MRMALSVLVLVLFLPTGIPRQSFVFSVNNVGINVKIQLKFKYTTVKNPDKMDVRKEDCTIYLDILIGGQEDI